MTDIFKNKIFKNTFFFIILAEILSFLGYYYPPINSLGFFIIALLTVSAALFKLESGLYILLTELFIGSFGYLFYFDLNGTQISLRLALWLIIMSVWLAKIIVRTLKTKRLAIDFIKSGRFAPFMVLLIFIGWGLVNGLINGNSLSNIFFDFNNWLYFLLVFPVFMLLPSATRATNAGHANKHPAFLAQIQEKPLAAVKPIFLAAITWLSLKTIFLAYIFTHNFHGLDLEIYGWMRADRLGEITQTAAGFSRIFMQSHIFILIGFFILLIYLLTIIITSDRLFFVIPALKPKASRNPEISSTNIFTAHAWIAGQARNDSNRDFLLKTKMVKCIILLTLFLSAIIISFSRSFWLGLAAGGAFVWLIAIFKLKIEFKKFIIYNSIILLIIISSLILTAVTVKFPFPKAYGGFNPADLLSQRITQITNEAGASSRWQLLTPLWQKIKTAALMGRGFGAIVTYKTNDPRVLATNPDGLYTTYSFEWGWLDVWLKLGLFGLLAYLFLFIKIIRDGLKITPFNKGGRGDLMLSSSDPYLSLSLATGLIVLMAVNIFSPYINHPLGIGYIILAAAMMEDIKIKKEDREPL